MTSQMNFLDGIPTAEPKPAAPAKPVVKEWYIVLEIDSQPFFVFQNSAGIYELKSLDKLGTLKPRRWSNWKHCHQFMRRRSPFKYDGWDNTYKIVEWTGKENA